MLAAALVLLVLSAAFNAAMWKLQFHFSTSVFGGWKEQFWNPRFSWRNKWATDASQPYHHIRHTLVGQERFWGSSRWLVFLTDGFHLMQFLHRMTLFACMACLLCLRPVQPDVWLLIGAFIGLWFIYATAFSITFKLLAKRQ